jgi:hypothetical protein
MSRECVRIRPGVVDARKPHVHRNFLELLTAVARVEIMKRVAIQILLLGLTAGATFASSPVGAGESLKTYEFRNGRWFDGEKFVARKAWSEWGRLRFSRPANVEAVVDLQGGYAIPPLCEAHNHNLGGDDQNAEAINSYLDAGIFYVKILSNLPRHTGSVRHLFNRPDSVDVSFANGGLTGPGGHPIRLREMLLGRGAYPDFTKETLVDHAYFVLESQQSVEQKWPLILQYRPDFIKILLLYSEEYDKRRDDPKYFGNKGLDPELVPLIAARAHAHGLRVSAHIETAHDFHAAVAGGVDELAHLGGDASPETIAPEDARLAARKGTVVVTTANLVKRREGDAARYRAIREAQKANLRLLNDAGVTLAIGSDDYEADSRKEAAYLRELGVFTDLELLTMWTKNCARTTFRDRFIGELRERYEASFITLDGNPLQDWSAIKRIRYRFKDGRPLLLP